MLVLVLVLESELELQVGHWENAQTSRQWKQTVRREVASPPKQAPKKVKDMMLRQMRASAGTKSEANMRIVRSRKSGMV